MINHSLKGFYRFYRSKLRGIRPIEIKKARIERVVRFFQEDWSCLIIVAVDQRLNEAVHKVIAGHSLRGFDAIHLASALAIGAAVSDEFLFSCYDDRLNQAARAEGLKTFPLR